jgi:riboflavin-specific deaminase-like protein
MRSHDRAPRPRIIANLAMSVDGKIDSALREGAGFSSRLDRDRMDRLRADADALLVGAATVRTEDPPLHIKDPARRHQRAAAGRREELLVVVVSRRGKIDPGARFLREPAAARVLAVPGDLDPSELAPLDAHVASGALEIFKAGAGAVDLRALVSALQQRGSKTVLVEGGGELIASFLEADLLDELHVTLCPTLLGGRTAPTPVGGAGWPIAERRTLQLAGFEQAGNELYLRYDVTQRQAAARSKDTVAER